MRESPHTSKHKGTIGNGRVNRAWHPVFLEHLRQNMGRINDALRAVGKHKTVYRDHTLAFPEFKAEVDKIIQGAYTLYDPGLLENQQWWPVFFAEFRESGLLTLAAQVAGVTTQDVYSHLAQYPAFKQHYDAAVEEARDAIRRKVQERLDDRQVVTKEVIHPDGTVEREYDTIRGNDLLLMFEAKRVDPSYRDNAVINVNQQSNNFVLGEQDATKGLARAQQLRAHLLQSQPVQPQLPAPVSYQPATSTHNEELPFSDQEWAFDDETGDIPF